MDCVFCKIVKKEIPANVVEETDDLIVFASIDPAADYHYLVTPKKHIKEFVELEDERLFDEMRKMAQKLINKYNFADAYKLIFNGGKYPGTRHLHWHVLGGEMDAKLHEKV